MKIVPTAFLLFLERDDKRMKKEERRYDRKEFGTAGKLIGLIYEQSPNEYMMTSAEFTDEELKTIQRILENHMDESVVVVGTSEELNVDQLYQQADELGSKDEVGITEEEANGIWLTPAAVSKIETLCKEYSKYEEKRQKIQEQLRTFINGYMNKRNLWKKPDAILEVISCLPPCYLRFNLYESYYEITEKMEKNKGRKNKGKGECR